MQAVGALADALRDQGKINTDVRAAAWLHDLGYAPELAETGFHPLDGARALRELGAAEAVVGLVAHHTGACFEAEERGLARELKAMPVPDQADLDAVTLIDLVTGPDGSPTAPQARIEEILKRYEPQSPVHRAVSRSAPELLASAERARRRLGLSDVWPAGVLEGVRQA